MKVTAIFLVALIASAFAFTGLLYDDYSNTAMFLSPIYGISGSARYYNGLGYGYDGQVEICAPQGQSTTPPAWLCFGDRDAYWVDVTSNYITYSFPSPGINLTDTRIYLANPTEWNGTVFISGSSKAANDVSLTISDGSAGITFSPTLTYVSGSSGPVQYISWTTNQLSTYANLNQITIVTFKPTSSSTFNVYYQFMASDKPDPWCHPFSIPC